MLSNETMFLNGEKLFFSGDESQQKTVLSGTNTVTLKADYFQKGLTCKIWKGEVGVESDFNMIGDMFELGEESAALHKKVFAHAMKKGFHLVVGIGEESSKGLCNLAYKNVATLKKRFRVDVSAGDVVLLKASHAMKLGTLIEE